MRDSFNTVKDWKWREDDDAGLYREEPGAKF